MSTPMRTYILCPDFDHPPGSIALGHIIATPSTPWITLNGKDRVVPEDSSVSYRTVRGWKSVWTTGKTETSGAFDVFLRIIGLNNGPTASSQTEITADIVETTAFEPIQEYLEKCLQSQGVQRFLVASRYRKPLFIVTGIMVAKGANFAKSTSLESSSALSADLTASGVPIPVGPISQSSLVNTKSSGISFDATSDFVFAYRLKKITLRKGGSLARTKDSISGNLYDSDRHFEVDKGDGGAEDIKDVVAETVKDTEKK